MGKNRTRGGGYGNGNRNNDNNNNHGSRNNNGNKNGKKWCSTCKKDNHNTNDCKFKNNGQNKQNSKVTKNNNSNNGNNKGGCKTNFCERCGFLGHENKACTKKEIDNEEDWCVCGSEFHYTNQCPWDKDPDKRELIQSKATGKICQWCKADGDGRHEYSECHKMDKFRIELLAKIKGSYDHLLWCWHCQSDNHKTRACEGPAAKIGLSQWDASITAIIHEWLYTDQSAILRQMMENEDVAMGLAGTKYKSPIAADFRWCFYCNAFGHYPDPNDSCDTSDYDARQPARFKNQEVIAAKHYLPANMRSNLNDDSPVPAFFLNGAQRKNDAIALIGNATGLIRVQCQNGCKTWFNMQREPGKGGSSSYCDKCQGWTQHPSSINRRDSKAELIKQLRKMVEATTGITSDKKKNKQKQEYIDKYKFRPSIALPLDLAVDRWPEVQPRYDDLGVIPEGEEKPLFDREKEGDVFNAAGNAQSYFPPVMIRLTSSDKAIAADKTQPINRAGYMGLELMCNGCGTYGIVRDAEGNVVMCSVDPACTVGCGYGEAEWTGVADRLRCRCGIITGRASQPTWIERV